MQSPGTPTIDQLRVFVAVVEAGSFAAAGRRLGRATSAIAYTIANLETQLGIALFDRERTRKPTLTDAGKIVLGKARAVSAGVDDLRASVKGLLGGLEPELSLVVDVLMPVERLVDVLQAFEATYPTVKLRLHVEALGAVAQLVQRGMASIGIGGMLHTSEAGLERVQVGEVELIPVAGPHPSFGQRRSASAGGVAPTPAIGPYGPVDLPRRTGCWGVRQRRLAARRPRRQTRPTSRRDGLGKHAGTERARGYCGRKAGASRYS
jgi:DNA-binding transcriptional LysR family regulator